MNHSSSIKDASAESLLTEVADEFTQRLNRGEQPEIEAYAKRYPQIATVLRQVLPALQMMRTLSTAPTSGVGVASSAGPPDDRSGVAGQLGDFRIVREIGRGGMGIVYEAEQVSLGRRVALKVLPFAAVMDHRQLGRFKAEAQAAAQLHHTNIVPVHSVGCERGVHYYAMQYIDGDPLSAVIGELRQLTGLAEVGDGGPADSPSEVTNTLASGRWAPAKAKAEEGSSAAAGLPANSGSGALGGITTERSTRSPAFFRSIANLGVQAAGALEHAHDMGVIHRDIKPSNLLLDTRGHLWVTDFGLAHCQTNGGKTLTMAGDLLGTLRYMSPEQALAKRVVIDHRTDIYSLGVTLYELLTLEPAFTGRDRQELLRQIAFEEPRSPRRLNDAIPADLETIVLKAVEKNPAGRYETAQEMADDMRRFLEDKPILAKRPTLAQRAVKWSRRHRSVVVSAAILVVMAAAGLSVGTVLLWRERGQTLAEQARTKEALAQVQINFDNAEAQRERAEEERERAEANFQQARQAVDDYYTLVSQSMLLNRPDLQDLRKELLQTALAYYQTFAKQRADDPEIQAELAAAYFRVAVITNKIGSGDWLTPLQKGLEIAAQLVADSADVTRFPSWRGGMLNLRRGRGIPADQAAEALRWFQKAVVIWERLVQENPNVAGLQNDLAFFYYAVGVAQLNTGDESAGVRSCSEAGEIWEKLARDHPTEPEYRYQLAQAHHELGGALMRNVGRSQEGAEEYRQVIDILEKLVADFPDVPAYRFQLGESCHMLGLRLTRTGQLEEVENSHRKAVAIYEKLAADFPNVRDYRYEVGECYHDLATTLSKAGDRVEAEELYRKALANRAQLAQDFPDEPLYRTRLAQVYGALWDLLKATSRTQEAPEAYHRAIGILQKLVTDFPNEPHYRRQLAVASLELGGLLIAEPDGRAEAEKEFRRAQAVIEKLVADFPNDTGQRQWAAGHCNNLAWQLVTDPNASLRDPDLAVELSKKAVEWAPKSGGCWATLGVAHYYRTGDWKAAVEALSKAMDLGLLESVNWFFLAMTHQRLGNDREARLWYDAATWWMAKHAPHRQEELTRFRAEAADVLGLPPPSTQTSRPSEADGVAIHTAILKAHPKFGWAHANRATAYAELKQWDKAAADFAKASELDPNDPYPRYKHALVCLALGDNNGYRDACAGMVRRFGKTEHAETAFWTAWTCALAPDGVADFATPIRLAEMAVRITPGYTSYHQTLGAIFYRAGRFEDATRPLGKAATMKAVRFSPAYTWFFLAMAEHQLAHPAEARKWFEKAVEHADQEMQGNPAWNRRLTLQLLRQEAASVLGIDEEEAASEKE